MDSGGGWVGLEGLGGEDGLRGGGCCFVSDVCQVVKELGEVEEGYGPRRFVS